MSSLEMKKLMRIIDYDFVIQEASNLRYEELVADQWDANSFIRSSLEESIASQFLRSTLDRNLKK